MTRWVHTHSGYRAVSSDCALLGHIGQVLDEGKQLGLLGKELWFRQTSARSLQAISSVQEMVESRLLPGRKLQSPM